ncbi:extracellular solute-binding protein [Thermostaphylospora chromogena]|uniref:Putative spermidine/putrescine transport system substrate-binding protein n=1 Tax=Thermostaphylospora chromogena TaxID=35622 RepID=A0A1H1FDG5_9ACTN|nr:extracellular solute-binding protein [Thermostaphylospora chromogena]SDQ99035.1 putative spermidine/putrescine transport system substrate-binding protein [Thermostaphylospora chromogena]
MVTGGRRLAALLGAAALVIAASAGVPSQASGPAAAPASTPSPSPTVGEGEGMLAVLTYRGYAEYGGGDRRTNWVGPFEEETGCRVTVLDQVRTADELIQRFPAKAYDVVAVSPEAAGQLIAEERVQPVDTSLIRAYERIPERLRELPAYTDGERVYGVPFLWRANRLIYDRDKAPTEKWSGLYRNAAVAIEDTPLSIADAALALGADDPFRLTSEQLDEAVALLAERDDDERVYWADRLDVVQGFAAGELRVAQGTPYELDVLEKAGRPVAAAGVDRVTGRADAWMLAAEAPHPNCAYLWLNWIASAEVQGEAAAWNGLAPANLDACDEDAARVCDLYGVADAKRAEKLLERIAFAVRPSADCGDTDADTVCADYTRWQERWAELAE